jgi:hypothetical protein
MNIYMAETDYCVLFEIYQFLTETGMTPCADPRQTIACCQQIVLKRILIHGF